ncbi:hypothetical protein R3P38DRAFT_2540037 [Favolaschia claudopus]|uniref:Uncharacterized protein n=1 Tax=Favolaschia claudopus TaxID=2862362 RepID=A0AAW0AYD7_9AGAR
MDDVCTPQHDWRTAALTLCLCIGLVISYLPQHFRIIRQNTSEGLSPWFLLLGSTSSAAGFLNLVTVQHTQIRCCTVQTLSQCVESVAGIVQVGLQWAMFTFIFVLYMLYFPQHLKFETSDEELRVGRNGKPRTRSKLWALSVALANITVAHFLLSALFTLVVVLSAPSPFSTPTPPSPYPDPSFPDPDPDHSHLPLSITRWALFLGVSSAILAAVQYLPQISFTWRARLVGALSVPMMCVQSPGAVAMVLSIALRPGTNWTSWITYAVAGLMQFTLLSICITWKIRQHRLHIDDFGMPIHPETLPPPSTGPFSAPGGEGEGEEVPDVPGLVVEEEEDPNLMIKALESALGEAAAGDVRDGVVSGDDDETMPLITSGANLPGQEQEQDGQSEAGDQGKGKARVGWW